MSSGEDYRDDDFLDLYGTPPLRRSSGRPRKSGSGQGSRRRRSAQEDAPGHPVLSARQEAFALSEGKDKQRKQAREFKALNTTLQVLGIDGLQAPSSSRITASPHAPLQEAISGRRISRLGSSISLSEASSIGYPDSPRESAALGSAFGRLLTPTATARRSNSDERDRIETRRHSGFGARTAASDVRDAQARVDHFLSGQVSVAALSIRNDAWGEAEDWQQQLTAHQLSPDAGLQECAEAAKGIQKALAEAKPLCKALAAKVSSLALQASERYLIMQAMYEQASRSLVALGSAVQSHISSYRAPEGNDIPEELFSDGSHGGLKVAASVTGLQHKLASRLRKLIEACREAHQQSETSERALSNLSQAGSKLVKAAALAISKLQAHALTRQDGQQGAISASTAKTLSWCWDMCGCMVQWTREHAVGHLSPVEIWEATLSQAAESTTWLVKAVQNANEAVPGAGFSYRNALATPARPTLQQQAATCTAWLPTIAEALWKEATRLAHAAGADDAESETAASESMSEVCANMNRQLASVLVKLAEAWTDLLESIPELQLETSSRRSLSSPGPAPACSRWAMEQLESQACKMIRFVHALGESKIVHTGHQGLWRSTEAVINAVLDWRHILATPHLQGLPSRAALQQQAPGLPAPVNPRMANGQPAHRELPPSPFRREAMGPSRTGQARRPRPSSHGRSAGRSVGRAQGTSGRVSPRTQQLPSPFASAPGGHRATANGPPSLANGPSLPQLPEASPAPWVPADELGHARLSFRDALKAGRRPLVGANGVVLAAAAIMPPWEGQPDWAVSREEVESLAIGDLHKMLGSGSCGAIWMLYFEATFMAVKIPLADEVSRQQHLQQFSKELRIHKRVSGHPNVVGFLKAWCHVATPERPFTGLLDRLSFEGISMAILMELCKLGSLHNLIRKAGEVAASQQQLSNGIRGPSVPAKNTAGAMLYFQWKLRLKLAQGAAAAVAYMHGQRPVLLHSDLKSANFLVTEDFVSKVCDFNLSDILEDCDGCIPGGDPISPPWSAPERLSGKAFGMPADVYSFGVVIWELIMLETPWSREAHCKAAAAEKSETASASSSCDSDPGLEPVPEEPEVHSDGRYWKSETTQLAWLTENIPNGARLPLPDPNTFQPQLPELGQLCALVKRCWALNPAERPSMVQVSDELQQLHEQVGSVCNGLAGSFSSHVYIEDDWLLPLHIPLQVGVLTVYHQAT
ncbi:hypothetical protein WJX74_005804 [Apatococcus lobatus]|uniref:Protein kinase domain-containing protein n=1 Tax=Apatococcus lobatus TaxID=904363 RepID=A0AAW1S9V9_9CHLO